MSVTSAVTGIAIATTTGTAAKATVEAAVRPGGQKAARFFVAVLSLPKGLSACPECVIALGISRMATFAPHSNHASSPASP
jgi:hypothetical protein